MTIKICSYLPEEDYIFSNFIPITDSKRSSYLIFFEKSTTRNDSIVLEWILFTQIFIVMITFK